MIGNEFFTDGFNAGMKASILDNLSAPKHLTKNQRKEWNRGYDAAINKKQKGK